MATTPTSRIFALLVVLATLCVSACGGRQVPAPVPVSLGQAPNTNQLPLEWRGHNALDERFPRLLPSFIEERKAAGRKFLDEDVQISPQHFEQLKSFSIFGTNAKGDDFARAFTMTKAGNDYQVSIKETSEDYRQSVSIKVDARLRLIEYAARRIRESSIAARRSQITCRWRDGKPAERGYIVAKTGMEEKFYQAKDKLVPEELTVMLLSFLPEKNIDAEFQIFSAAFRSGFRCDLSMRPAKDSDNKQRMIGLHTRTPLAWRTWYLVDANNQMFAGFDESGTRLYASTSAEIDTLNGLYALRNKERDHMLFNGGFLFSRYSPKGELLARDNPEEAARSWLRINTQALDLVVSPQPRRPSAIMAHLVDNETLANYNRRVTSGVFESHGALGTTFRADETHLLVLLEAKPRTLSLEQFAQGAASAEMAQGSVQGYRGEALRVSGYPAYRYEYVIRRPGRKGRVAIQLPPLFHSVLLINVKGIIVRVAMSVGEGWRDYTGGVRAIQKAIQIKAPPAFSVKK